MVELFQPNHPLRSLDLDVFDSVCTFLMDYSDLLSLSLTCSFVRPLAIRNLLRSHPVVLKNVDAIVRFHDFVFANPDSRLQHVTALKIIVAQNETRSHLDSASCERAIESLLALLSQAPSLTSLELLSGWEWGYFDDPRISAALSSLETLRELRIAGNLSKTANFIPAVRSPLAKVAFWFMPSAVGPDWTPASLCTTLSHVAQFLESLTIKSSIIRIAEGRLPDPPSTLTQFHTVRSLTLDHLRYPPHLPSLLALFPNLDGTLHLIGDGYEDPEDPGDWDPGDKSDFLLFLRSIRAQNGRAQEQERRGWRRLERLVCDADTLFALNLKCPIGLTVLPHCDIDNERAERVAEALREHPPAKLNLQFVFGGVGLSGVEYKGLIPPEAAATLTHLTVCVKHEFTRSDVYGAAPVFPMRWGELWRFSILPALQHGLRALTHLRLVFHCEAFSQAGDATHSILRHALLEHLRPASFNFAAVASAIVDEIPSLRYCFVSVGAWVGKGCPSVLVERWCESRAWRVVRRVDDTVDAADGTCACGAGRELVELHHDVAETIITKEDLGVSMDEAKDMRWDRSDVFGGMYE